MLSACPACLRCQSSQYWSWANVETHEQDWQPAAAKMLKATKGMPEILPRGRKWERSLDEALGTLATFCWSHTWKRRKTRNAYTYVYIYIPVRRGFAAEAQTVLAGVIRALSCSRSLAGVLQRTPYNQVVCLSAFSLSTSMAWLHRSAELVRPGRKNTRQVLRTW